MQNDTGFDAIFDSDVKISDRLQRRLERVAKIIDLSVVYLNKEVALLQPGAYFGELALQAAGETRKASIKMRSDAFLAYLDRHDYDTVMQGIMNRG